MPSLLDITWSVSGLTVISSFYGVKNSSNWRYHKGSLYFLLYRPSTADKILTGSQKLFTKSKKCVFLSTLECLRNRQIFLTKSLTSSTQQLTSKRLHLHCPRTPWSQIIPSFWSRALPRRLKKSWRWSPIIWPSAKNFSLFDFRNMKNWGESFK